MNRRSLFKSVVAGISALIIGAKAENAPPDPKPEETPDDNLMWTAVMNCPFDEEITGMQVWEGRLFVCTAIALYEMVPIGIN
jgi:hypothetical protein